VGVFLAWDVDDVETVHLRTLKAVAELPLPLAGEFEVVIMIAVGIEEMHGSD